MNDYSTVMMSDVSIIDTSTGKASSFVADVFFNKYGVAIVTPNVMPPRHRGKDFNRYALTVNGNTQRVVVADDSNVALDAIIQCANPDCSHNAGGTVGFYPFANIGYNRLTGSAGAPDKYLCDDCGN